MWNDRHTCCAATASDERSWASCLDVFGLSCALRYGQLSFLSQAGCWMLVKMSRESATLKVLSELGVACLAVLATILCVNHIASHERSSTLDSWAFCLAVAKQDILEAHVNVVRRAHATDRNFPDKLVISTVSSDTPGEKTAVFEDMRGGGNDFLQYKLESVECRDLDGDGMSEIIAYWESGPMCNWCILSMTAYRYDPDTRAVAPVRVLAPGGELRSSLLGGFRITNIDSDPALEVMCYTPVFSNDEEEGFECMVCPHRYSIAVYEYCEGCLARDGEWNGGMPATTELKFYQSTFEDRMMPMYLSSSLYNRSSSAKCGPIVISSPEPDELLTPPIEVSGEAPAEGTALFTRIMDEGGNVLHLDRLRLHDKVEGVGARFHAVVYPARPTSSTGLVEIVALDGTAVSEALVLVSVPVRFDTSFGERCLVYMYKETGSWNESGPHFVAVGRWVPPSKRDAMLALLEGPTEEEAASGMRGQACSSVIEIRELTVEAGHAEVALYGTGWDPLRLEWVSEEDPVDTALLSEQIGRTLCEFPGITSVTTTCFGGPLGDHSHYSYVPAAAGR